jgi:hypothetical protein
MAGEEVKVHAGSAVTVAMRDGTVREFAGPTTLVIEHDRGGTGGTVLANLASALIDMLFRQEERASETVMATRHVAVDDGRKMLVPVLVHPAPGARLLRAPAVFEWIGIQGVRLYRVSVYSTRELLWQETTSASRAGCPAEGCDLRPGETYYWVVEALVGDTTLRPEAADFEILGAEAREGLESALTATDSSVGDSRTAMILKVNICMDANVFDTAAEILDRYIEDGPSDRTAYMLRGEISERMGLAEDAVHYYRKALMALPPD